MKILVNFSWDPSDKSLRDQTASINLPDMMCLYDCCDVTPGRFKTEIITALLNLFDLTKVPEKGAKLSIFKVYVIS